MTEHNTRVWAHFIALAWAPSTLVKKDMVGGHRVCRPDSQPLGGPLVFSHWLILFGGGCHCFSTSFGLVAPVFEQNLFSSGVPDIRHYWFPWHISIGTHNGTVERGAMKPISEVPAILCAGCELSDKLFHFSESAAPSVKWAHESNLLPKMAEGLNERVYVKISSQSHT